MSVCDGCGYNLGDNCQVLKHKQIESCSSKADTKEIARRENDIKEYFKRHEQEQQEKQTVRERLHSGFMELYGKGYNDKVIAVKLEMSAQSVGDYRRDLKLKALKKRKKPAVTGK